MENGLNEGERFDRAMKKILSVSKEETPAQNLRRQTIEGRIGLYTKVMALRRGPSLVRILSGFYAEHFRVPEEVHVDPKFATQVAVPFLRNRLSEYDLFEPPIAGN